MGLSVGHPPVAVNGTEDPVRTVLSRPISWLWEIFTILAKACAGLDAQLVLSLGSRDQAPDGALAGAPVLAGSICAANRVAEARHAGNHARRAEYSLGVLEPRRANGGHPDYQRSARCCQPARMARGGRSRGTVAAFRAAAWRGE